MTRDSGHDVKVKLVLQSRCRSFASFEAPRAGAAPPRARPERPQGRAAARLMAMAGKPSARKGRWLWVKNGYPKCPGNYQGREKSGGSLVV